MKWVKNLLELNKSKISETFRNRSLGWFLPKTISEPSRNVLYKSLCYLNLYLTLREKCTYLQFFWYVFCHIQTEYGEIVSLRIQFECGKIRSRKTRTRTLFTQWQLKLRILKNIWSRGEYTAEKTLLERVSTKKNKKLCPKVICAWNSFVLDSTHKKIQG